MTERNRIIDAFRNCITEPKCKDCPWTECNTLNNGCVAIPRDLALAVMRELVTQEPRILTKKDMENTEPGTVVWCEQRDEIRTYMIPMIKYDDGMFECRFLGASSEAADLANIRFWSARPSDQLREATPW